VHEPTIQRLERPQEILDALQDMQARGMITSYGLAGALGEIKLIIQKFPNIAPILQTGENEWRATDTLIPDITFSALGQGPQSAFSSGRESTVTLDRLRSALHRRSNGVVLVFDNQSK